MSNNKVQVNVGDIQYLLLRFEQITKVAKIYAQLSRDTFDMDADSPPISIKKEELQALIEYIGPKDPRAELLHELYQLTLN